MIARGVNAIGWWVAVWGAVLNVAVGSLWRDDDGQMRRRGDNGGRNALTAPAHPVGESLVRLLTHRQPHSSTDSHQRTSTILKVCGLRKVRSSVGCWNFTARFPPPPSHPAHKLLEAQAEVERERDLGLRIWLEEFKQLHPAFMLSRMEGGQDFRSQPLARVFSRYASRIAEHGPYSFPTSFNVVESFLSFSHKFLSFDLRNEREHVLRLSDGESLIKTRQAE